MSNRWIAIVLLLALGFGVPAHAQPPAAGAASSRHGGILAELTSDGAALLLALKSGDGGLCGTGYCPTPPPPPPPIHTMSIATVKSPARRGSRP